MRNHPYSQISIPANNHRPFVALNMVSSLNGKVTINGKLNTDALSGQYDRATMNQLRSHFDGVICGAATIRQHPYFLGVPANLVPARIDRGLKPQPETIIVSNSGDIPKLRHSPQQPIIVTGSPQVAADHQESVVVLTKTSPVDFSEALDTLYSQYGLRHLLLEGGPTLNREFFREELVDEIFITLAPKIVATNDLGILTADPSIPLIDLELISSFAQENELYLRYRVIKGHQRNDR